MTAKVYRGDFERVGACPPARLPFRERAQLISRHSAKRASPRL